MAGFPRHATAVALLAAALGAAACLQRPVAAGAHAAPRETGATGPAAEGRELAADQQVAHALNRLTFGPRPGDVDRVRALGVDRWIELQLRPERIPDAAMDDVVRRFEMLGAAPGEVAASYARVRQARRRQAAGEDTVSRETARRRAMAADPELRAAARRVQRAVADVQAAKVARAVASERQLYEVMVDFWANHFSVFAGKGQTRLFLTHYDATVIRPHALGKFRDLLGAVARSPAMLFYLDNWQSAADSGRATLKASAQMRRCALPGARCARPFPRMTARGPRTGAGDSTRAPRRPRGLNENYARELLELHTVGAEGGYTQHDVVEVARALTGWSMDPRDGAFVFRPAAHDAEEKTVLGRRLPAGRGIEDGEQVLDLLARHPATAHHLARKLAQRFVSDSPPPELVARAAATYLRTDGDLREMVRTIVTSPEFFSRGAYRAKVKSPFELVVSALRAVNAAADTTPRTASLVARLGQPIFGRQTPDGWPETGEEWMNAGAILNRINFGLAVAGGRVPGVTLDRWPHAAALRGAAREAQVEGVVRAILGGEASPETWAILRAGENPLARGAAADPSGADGDGELMSGAAESAGAGRTRAGARRAASRGPGGALGRPVALGGLAQLVGLALGAPEFQRK